MKNLTVVSYVLYLVLAVPLTAWVARALHRYGQVFLNDVFVGDTDLARAVNQLLVIGFYLLNVGYVLVFMTEHGRIGSVQRLMEVLSVKVGGVAIVVGVLHFANVWAFNSFRRRAVLRAKAIPPVAPSGYLAVTPAMAGGPAETPPFGGTPAPRQYPGGWTGQYPTGQWQR